MYFIVLEQASYGDLFQYMDPTKKLPPFSEPVARYIMDQLLEGLFFCHSNGIAHRDIKLENILLDSRLDEDTNEMSCDIKIADFGTAGNCAGLNGSGLLGTVYGTIEYMAPEILEKKQYNPMATDVFSLGAVFFILVSGIPAFKKAHPFIDREFK